MTDQLIEEAAKVAYEMVSEVFGLAPDWGRVGSDVWHRIAVWQRDYWATHTEPASDVTLVEALRLVREHFAQMPDDVMHEFAIYPANGVTCVDVRPSQFVAVLQEQADRLEAERADRERDVRIGRAIRAFNRDVTLNTGSDAEYDEKIGRYVIGLVREAVESELGQS